MNPAQSESDVNLSTRRRAWADVNVTREDLAMVQEDAGLFLHQSVSTPCLSALRRAEGIWIEDMAGRRYMDFHGNNVHHIGYGHPRLKAAIMRQMDELPFAPRRFTNEPAILLARKLAAIAPGRLSKVLFTTGGSDALEVALKIARAATGRFKTISFWDAFHGAGFGAASVGGEQLFRSGKIGPLLPGTEHVAPFACYRCPYGHPDIDGAPDLERCRLACASYLRYVLEREGDVAAVIAEPARAVPVLPPPGYWRAVREACNAHGALLIFDEIPTGLGKTGRMFASEHDGVEPDILVLGKALGGGIVPIAATLCRPELDVGGEYAFGHYTHEKNPVSARAALTTIEIIEDENLVDNAAQRGHSALARLHDMKRRHPLIGDVRGRGLLLGIELVRDRDSKVPASDAAEEIMYRALDEGLSFKTTMGNVLTLTPPLIVTEDQMMRALDVIEGAITEIERRPAASE
jgi:4-aminobutyrate aminotransferase